MGSPLFLILFTTALPLFISTSTTTADPQQSEPATVVNHIIGRYAFESYNRHNKTGILYKVRLPANLSGLGADVVRFRCGSLRRYGAQVVEFSIPEGVIVQDCVERVLIVRQNLGDHWSSVYYDSYSISGYQLASHVLGLAAYDTSRVSSTNLSEVRLLARKNPLKIDFSNVAKIENASSFLCASFDSDGRVSVSPQVSQNVCVATRSGHFGLVVESLVLQTQTTGKLSRWKIIVGSTLGGALGVFLLGLLLNALCVKVKKRSQKVEMERRAYQEEALQISMVGHVRAPMAYGTRTLPTLEHAYIPPM